MGLSPRAGGLSPGPGPLPAVLWVRPSSGRPHDPAGTPFPRPRWPGLRSGLWDGGSGTAALRTGAPAPEEGAEPLGAPALAGLQGGAGAGEDPPLPALPSLLTPWPGPRSQESLEGWLPPPGGAHAPHPPAQTRLLWGSWSARAGAAWAISRAPGWGPWPVLGLDFHEGKRGEVLPAAASRSLSFPQIRPEGLGGGVQAAWWGWRPRPRAGLLTQHLSSGCCPTALITSSFRGALLAAHVGLGSVCELWPPPHCSLLGPRGGLEGRGSVSTKTGRLRCQGAGGTVVIAGME